MATLIGCVFVIWLVLWPVRIVMRRAGRIVPPAVQVIIVQPGQLPQPPASAAAPVQSQYSQPFSPGFLGLNRQN
jgi:hypothetical protein